MFDRTKKFCGSCYDVLSRSVGTEGDAEDGMVAVAYLAIPAMLISLILAGTVYPALVLGGVLLVLHLVRYLM